LRACSGERTTRTLLAFSSNSFFRARLSSFTFSIAARWRRMTVCASSQYAFRLACAASRAQRGRARRQERVHAGPCGSERGDATARMPRGCGTCAAAPPAATPRRSRSACRARAFAANGPRSENYRVLQRRVTRDAASERRALQTQRQRGRRASVPSARAGAAPACSACAPVKVRGARMRRCCVTRGRRCSAPTSMPRRHTFTRDSPVSRAVRPAPLIVAKALAALHPLDTSASNARPRRGGRRPRGSRPGA
jgi:hypothetical protein